MTEMTRIAKDAFIATMTQGLLGSTSRGRMVVNMQQLDAVMADWPLSEQFDVVGAVYAFIFDELWSKVKEDMIHEGESDPTTLQQAEIGFLQFVAARITMDVLARVFKDKVIVLKAHKITDDLDQLLTLPNPLVDLYEDNTGHGNP